MKKILIGALCLIGVCGPLQAAAKVPQEPRATAEQNNLEAESTEKADQDQKEVENVERAKEIVVARVNGTEISMYSLIRSMNLVAPRYVEEGEPIGEELTQKIKQKALDNLITAELAIQQAVAQGITIAPEEIQQVVDRVKESVGSEEAYQTYLLDRGLTEEKLKKQIERSRQREIIMAREIYGKVEVKEEEIKKNYDQMKEARKLWRPDEYIVKDILLMKGESEEATRNRAVALLNEVKNNSDDFGKLILDGTFITRRLKVDKDKNPAIYKEIAGMEVGTLSGVVKDRDSYHIFKLLQKEPGRDLTLEESRSFIENRLRAPAQEARKTAWEEELRSNAQIEILLDEVEEGGKAKAETAAAGTES